MRYPALDVRGVDAEIALAVALDYSPTAAEEHDNRVTLFFSGADARDQARQAIANRFPHSSLASLEVDDEDWARRSQASLKPITVGNVTIVPNAWNSSTPASLDSHVSQPEPLAAHAPSTNPQSLVPNHVSIAIAPSMGFGTGHHATTRLCLRALQELDLRGLSVLDVGTGSGILAIVARRLGAAGAVGFDHDSDAIVSADDNLRLNRGLDNVRFEVADLVSTALPLADVVTANLTGALLARAAAALTKAVSPGGSLIVSGLLSAEEDPVRAALGGLRLTRRFQEEEWVCLTFNRDSRRVS